MLLRSLALVALVPLLPLSAAEVVVFTSGARIMADRHERAGDIVKLFQGAGVSEVPAQVIADFELIESVSPPPEPVPAVHTRPGDWPYQPSRHYTRGARVG